MSERNILALPGGAPCRLGESPFWHPGEGCLYWCDITGRRLHRFDPREAMHAHWDFPSDVGCAAPLADDALLVACRDGLWRFDPASGERERIVAAPYDTTRQRFNDGKADPQGRLWVGTIDESREPRAALYRYAGGAFERVLDGAVTSNGLAFSPDGRTMYWSDTPRHEVTAFDFDGASGTLSRRRVLARFAPRAPGDADDAYAGRPDGAAVDSEGCYWVAMYEGARVLRLSPRGDVLDEIPLPARCPTMPCFGGPDLKTLYVTSASAKRPADELRRYPLSGHVLQLSVDVPGLPVNFACA
jgi:sugar lactone lactonase YvrE